MVEFVQFTSPHVGQDLATRKVVRSQAMRDFRKRQRQSEILKSRTEVQPSEPKKHDNDEIKCVSDGQRSSGAKSRRRSIPAQTSRTLGNRTKVPIAEHPDTAQDSMLAMRDPRLPISYSVSLLPQVDAPERCDLHYFHHVVMKDIAGMVCVGFWDEFMPRLCQTEYVVRQAIIALSRTHADLAYNGSLRHPPTLRDRLSSIERSSSSLKASKALRRYIEESNSPSYELVLTCSIIFHALELMQGAEQSALRHLENGLAVFKAWKQQRQRSPSRSEEGFDEIATVLCRLDLSATIADDDRTPIFEYDQAGFSAPSVTDFPTQMRLVSAHDAHYQLMRVGTPAWAFLIRNRQWRNMPTDLVPDSIVQEHGFHSHQYRAWSVAADQLEWELSSRKRRDGTTHDVWEREQRVAVTSLVATRMHHWCSKRMLEEGLQDEDNLRPFDRNPHKLFRYARTIIKNTDDAEDGAEMCRRMSFSPEVGICAILFLCAHRTTDPKIRIEALRLARYFNRLEGAKDHITAFERWALLPDPKPGFPYMLGQPGF